MLETVKLRSKQEIYPIILKALLDNRWSNQILTTNQIFWSPEITGYFFDLRKHWHWFQRQCKRRGVQKIWVLQQIQWKVFYCLISSLPASFSFSKKVFSFHSALKSCIEVSLECHGPMFNKIIIQII